VIRPRLAFLLATVAFFAAVPFTRAGLYSPDEPCPFEVQPDGTAKELTFGTAEAGAFRIRYTVLLNALDANPARTENPDRQKYLDRIARLRATPTLSPAELAGLAADELRVRRPDEALNRLFRSRDRSDFRVLANLAHVHAARGEWGEAVHAHRTALLDADFPDDLAGTTPAQRAWLKKLEATHYARWLAVHQRRAADRVKPADEGIFPLFDVNFVGESGRYEPGTLAAAEKAKLPKDAVAVVQQLMLWSPDDAALQWLLAELYAAAGRLREAELIFNQIVESRQYSNRPLFMEHRSAVREAVAKLPKEQPPPDLVIAPTPADPPKPDGSEFLPSRERVAAVVAAFAVFVGVLIVLKLRTTAARNRPA
jgi:tetratricopeptide (TPR) repeat protein